MDRKLGMMDFAANDPPLKIIGLEMDNSERSPYASERDVPSVYFPQNARDYDKVVWSAGTCSATILLR